MKKRMKNLKIHKATLKEYEKFALGVLNRPLRPLTALISSMQLLGFLHTHPIIVEPDGKGGFLIRDGHHRFAAAKILGIAFYYVIESVPHSVAQIEATHKNWSPNDYVVAYMNKGLLDYAQLSRYHERTGVPISTCIQILGENTAMTEFKLGRFKVSRKKMMRAENVARIILTAKEAGVDFAAHVGFAHAVYNIAYLTRFDPNRMIRKIKSHSSKLTKMSDVPGYMKMLEGVYNTYAKDKVELAFPAQRLVEKRKTGRRKEKNRKGEK